MEPFLNSTHLLLIIFHHHYSWINNVSNVRVVGFSNTDILKTVCFCCRCYLHDKRAHQSNSWFRLEKISFPAFSSHYLFSVIFSLKLLHWIHQFRDNPSIQNIARYPHNKQLPMKWTQYSFLSLHTFNW